MATMEYKCPSCGAPLSFNPEKQNFACDYCGSEFTVQHIQSLYAQSEKTESINEQEVRQSEEQRAQAQKTGGEFNEDFMVSYSCPSCGAEIMTAESTAATECYYCGNPVVLGSRLSGEFKPDSVIPFALTKDMAVDAFMKMCGKKKFLPAGFANKKQFEKMQGVYFPYWYVDEKMQSSAVATGKKVRHWTSGNRRYTETSTYRLFRTGDIEIRNVFEEALRDKQGSPTEKPQTNRQANAQEAMKYLDNYHMQQRHEMLQCVHPFDVTKAVPFSMSYLSGFKAEKREIGKDEIMGTIAERMDTYAKQLLEDTMSGYQGISLENYSDRTFDQRWRYTLLPVWIITYKFKGQIMPFAINGQTGKTYGKLPVAGGKLALWGAIVALIVFVIAVLGGMFFL
ncbi:MAG: TFIIB-type zinc ribbon-containing protein [Ruminococcus sp.]|nr:TFIIB-type zinc ribbon-containing protein [Ruminococcus sp.]